MAKIRALVYFDSAYQRKYLEEIRRAATLVGGSVVAAGPVAGEGYFVLEGESSELRIASRPRHGLGHLRRMYRLTPSVLRAGGRKLLTIALRTKRAIDAALRPHSAVRMVKRSSADLIVLFEDNAEGLTGYVGHAARVTSTPLLIVPCYIPNPEEPAAYYRGSQQHLVRQPLAKFIATVSPKWVHEHDGVKLLRLPPLQIVANILAGRRFVRPWVLNSGFASAIAVESDMSRQAYRELGFLPQKLRVVGNGLGDALFANRSASRSTFLREQFKDPDRPLVVVGFPPDQYTGGSREGFEFLSFGELSESWFANLHATSERANFIVCPHPRLDIGLVRRQETDSIALFEGGLEQALPCADLYVACASTTIGWALSLGIPSVNYDCYGYKYKDFEKAAAVRLAENSVQFGEILRSILALDGDLVRLTNVAREEAAAWGIVDGAYCTRLAALMLELTSTPDISPTHMG